MEIKEIKTGVLFDKRPSDYILGTSPIVKTPLTDNWKLWTPEHERQNDVIETLSCVTYSSTDAIEYQFTYALNNGLISADDVLWLKASGYFKNGFINFSERFTAILGETTAQGAYQYKVGDAIRKFGLIPQDLFPTIGVKSFDEYLDKTKITKEMYDLGLEFIKRFPISYEWINEGDLEGLKEALKYSPVQVCVYYSDGDGVLCPTNRPQHAVLAVGHGEGFIEIDDSYIRQFKKYCHQAIYSPMLYTINFKTMFTYKKLKGDKNIWICREDNKTRAVFLDETSMNFFTDKFEEVETLAGYTSVGTNALFKREITD